MVVCASVCVGVCARCYYDNYIIFYGKKIINHTAVV